VKISLKQVVSGKIYLRDESMEFAVNEGNVKPEDAAWVRIRQAREGDFVALEEIRAKREIKYGNSASEIIDANPRECAKYQVWWTLHDCGNLLNEDDDPLFAKLPVGAMQFADFDAIWSNLDTCASTAILSAVWKVNPEWRTDQ